MSDGVPCHGCCVLSYDVIWIDVPDRLPGFVSGKAIPSQLGDVRGTIGLEKDRDEFGQRLRD
jgi:hypothetical protein